MCEMVSELVLTQTRTFSPESYSLICDQGSEAEMICSPRVIKAIYYLILLRIVTSVVSSNMK